MRRTTLTIPAGRDRVPGVLILPDARAPVPAALLLHGYTSRKEAMADGIGTALAREGVASLAVDLPMHGERVPARHAVFPRQSMEVVRHWRVALDEAAAALAFLRALPHVNADRVGVVGYSLGSFLAVTLAARDGAVTPVVLAAGGDLPLGSPLVTLARTVMDPTRSVRALRGRPLLMVNGRYDRTIVPEQAERLYAAAREPKVLRWWEAGHVLPDAAIRDAAAWYARQGTESGAA